MQVVRFVRRRGLSGRAFPCPAGSRIIPWDRARDARALADLAAGAEWPGPAGLSPTGLAGTLETRPGREVAAWVARAAAGHDATGPLQGLVGLVTTATAAGSRVSIAWILVRRDCRRRGIGLALVSQAVEHAHGVEIRVETNAAWPGTTAFWRAAGFEPA